MFTLPVRGEIYRNRQTGELVEVINVFRKGTTFNVVFSPYPQYPGNAKPTAGLTVNRFNKQYESRDLKLFLETVRFKANTGDFVRWVDEFTGLTYHGRVIKRVRNGNLPCYLVERVSPKLKSLRKCFRPILVFDEEIEIIAR